MLRGCKLKVVLHRCGRILRDSSSSAANYELSQPVDHLDIFLSHNWSTPRVAKFVTLAMHFNLAWSLIISMLAQCVFSVLTSRGMLPIYGCSYGFTGVLGLLLTRPLFFFILFFWHDITPQDRISQPRVFLDKVCIHQTDEVKKRQGIGMLGEILEKTSTLLCCYSDRYLRQLWTLYELTNFAIQHPVDSIKLVPTFMPVAIFGFIGCIHVVDLTAFLFTKETEIIRLIMLVFLVCLSSSILLRHSARQRALVLQAVGDSSIGTAHCSNEADRALVKDNATKLLRQRGFLKATDNEEQAVHKFNLIVRDHMPAIVSASLGRHGIPYQYVFCTGCMFFMPSYLEGAPAKCYVKKDCDWLWWLNFILMSATHVAAVAPLFIVAVTKMTSIRVDTGPWQEAGIIIVSTILSFTVCCVCACLDYGLLVPYGPRLFALKYFAYTLLLAMTAVCYLDWSCLKSDVVQRQPEVQPSTLGVTSDASGQAAGTQVALPTLRVSL